MSTILCNFALENLAENQSSYDRKISIPYRAGTIPSSVVQFHWHEPRVGSAVKPNRLVVFNFKLPISAYAPDCVPKVEIKERLIIHVTANKQFRAQIYSFSLKVNIKIMEYSFFLLDYAQSGSGGVLPIWGWIHSCMQKGSCQYVTWRNGRNAEGIRSRGDCWSSWW